MNKLEIEYEKENKIKSINWNELLYKLNFVEMKILELFYIPKSNALIFNEVYKEIRKINTTKRMVYKEIYKLQKMGVLEIIKNTKPMAINSYYLIEDNIKELIKQLKIRFGIL